MEITLDALYRFFISAVAILCTSNSLILLARSKYNKTRKVLSWILLLWGLIYFYRVFAFYFTDIYPYGFSVLRHNVLIIGNIFITLMYVFPLQVFIPGWLNVKRLFLLYLPLLLIILMYFVGMMLVGETPEELASLSQMRENITHFNVWYRIVLVFSNIAYMVGMLKWLYKYEKRYVKWKNENYSDLDYLDEAWMRSFGCSMIAIFTCYVALLLFGGKLLVIVHSCVVIFSFSYLFYKGLFYESPYPEDFFAKKPQNIEKYEMIEFYDPKVFQSDVNADCTVDNMENDETNKVNEVIFDSKLTEYIDSLKLWLREEKPYLYKEFKLTDVARVLPLNRSYLSRVFNEGFGCSFSEVVRLYRVLYAKEVLLKKPDLSVHDVGVMSGFSSISTFIRAFRGVMGVTPSQFRDREEGRKKTLVKVKEVEIVQSK